MDNCETCMHWERTQYPTARRMNAPTMEPEPGTWGACTLISEDYEMPGNEYYAETAFTRDSSDYKSWLMVRSDFGCVEHETNQSGGSHGP